MPSAESEKDYRTLESTQQGKLVEKDYITQVEMGAVITAFYGCNYGPYIRAYVGPHKVPGRSRSVLRHYGSVPYYGKRASDASSDRPLSSTVSRENIRPIRLRKVGTLGLIQRRAVRPSAQYGTGP